MDNRLIIAGGGLAGTLTACALVQARPDLEITLLEGGERLGGAHTWSFYETDLGAAETALVDPFVAYRWAGYEARFETFSRTFSTGYRSIDSASLHRRGMSLLGDRVRLGAQAATLDGGSVTLASGERIEAGTVIDARGPRKLAGVAIGWQKFLGQELRLVEPHGLVRPVIMDASVSQIDGYHFVYLLPFAANRILVEDTYYSDTADICADSLRQRIAAYVAARGWQVAEVIQEERGALPIPLAGDFSRFWSDAAPAGGAVPLGLRSGLFHAVTGYSLPDAARTAVTLAGLGGPFSSDRLRTEVETLAAARWRAGNFDRMLNRLLFLAGLPENRHRVLARFHRLPQPLIERFYAGRIPTRDRFRILCGIPPVPVRAALRVLPESAAPLPT